MTSNPFSNSYALSAFPTGGVAINLKTGDYFKMEPTTAEVFDLVLRAPTLEAADHLVCERLGLTPLQARGWLDELSRALEQSAPRTEPPGTYRFRVDEEGFSLHVGPRRALLMDAKGTELRLVTDERPSAERAEMYLRAVAAKVLFLLTFVTLPFVVRTVQPVLADIPREVEEAAACLPFLRRRKSSLIDGVGDDARDLSAHLASHLGAANRAVPPR